MGITSFIRGMCQCISLAGVYHRDRTRVKWKLAVDSHQWLHYHDAIMASITEPRRSNTWQ